MQSQNSNLKTIFDQSVTVPAVQATAPAAAPTAPAPNAPLSSIFIVTFHTGKKISSNSASRRH
ncbi:hypothetical protein [Nostoc sp.]|uniref:hypothetical protein n=1 Tax=Nostoc sp. TaxID=1180 RepID=UPI002FF89175